MSPRAMATLCVVLACLLSLQCYAQTESADLGRPVWRGDSKDGGRPAKPPAHPRVGLSGGLGVSYVNPQDIVDVVNATAGSIQRVQQFKAGVEFFAAAVIPLSEYWLLKIDYAYLLSSYNVDTQLGPAEYTMSVHLPTLIAQYVIVEEGTYNFKVGAGVGYHAGGLEEKFSTVNDRYSGKGPGFALDLEANTAFGDNFFGYLGANVRWEFIGELVNDLGQSPGTTGSRPTLHLFGLGARLGFTYYF